MPDTTPALRPTSLGENAFDVFTDDGVRLAVRDYLPPQPRHTLIFLHGLCLDWHTWERQIEYLRLLYPDTVRVINYDHRGHGQSQSAPMRTYCVERLATDLAQVLQACNVSGDLTLAGHSLGGITALAYCGRADGDRPVEPTGLILAATAAGRLYERGLGRLLATPGPNLLCQLVERAPEHLLRALTVPLSGTLRQACERVHIHNAALSMTASALASVSVQTAVGFLPSLRRYDHYATLRGIRARTVVLSGGIDPLTPRCHADDLAGGITQAQHVHVPSAGHMLPAEAAGAVNDALRTVIGPVRSGMCGVSA
jgi:pimeloyl-ACP methyl ester carboxylesterase